MAARRGWRSRAVAPRNFVIYFISFLHQKMEPTTAAEKPQNAFNAKTTKKYVLQATHLTPPRIATCEEPHAVQWSKWAKFSSPLSLSFLLCSGAYIHDATALSLGPRLVGSCLDKDIDSSPPPSRVLKEPCVHAIDFSHCSCQTDGRPRGRTDGRIFGA